MVVVRLTWLELKLLLREPLTVVFSLVLPLIILFVLGGVFGNEASQPGDEFVVYRGQGAMSYYVPAYLALVVASVCIISIPTHLAGNRERGVLKRFQASSVGAGAIAGAEVLVALVLSAASCVLLVVAAELGYDFVWPESVVGVVATLVALVVGFAAMGILLGVVSPTARAAQAVGVAGVVRDADARWGRSATRGADRHDGSGGRVHTAVARGAGGPPTVAGARPRYVVGRVRDHVGGERGVGHPVLPLGVTAVASGLSRW